MASIRVYLLTCRRPHLLRRALRSLMAQTFTDWACELHNDAPEDNAPARLLAELAPGDARFTYHLHDPQWGPVTSFNHCFRAGSEPYAALRDCRPARGRARVGEHARLARERRRLLDGYRVDGLADGREAAAL